MIWIYYVWKIFPKKSKRGQIVFHSIVAVHLSVHPSKYPSFAVSLWTCLLHLWMSMKICASCLIWYLLHYLYLNISPPLKSLKQSEELHTQSKECKCKMLVCIAQRPLLDYVFNIKALRQHLRMLPFCPLLPTWVEESVTENFQRWQGAVKRSKQMCHHNNVYHLTIQKYNSKSLMLIILIKPY